MRLSSMADYAVVMMCAAARHCGCHSADTPLLSAQRLATETGLPAPTVQKLVSKMAAAGLLKSVRGARGGLKLARPAAAISLADIVEAVEGPIAMAACSGHGRSDCTLEAACAVRPHWPAVDAALRAALSGVSLVQLARPAQSPKGAQSGQLAVPSAATTLAVTPIPAELPA
ncbi:MULTISPECIES: Rrf2 family transcriptional regulator [unclassified Novosphingobium]|uniref:RrF2 family transcriptional regulator n=1 Tax=unclassified Novosphingobium TaxID=2644732 RepID=UPI00146A62F4|nr:MULTISPECIES: Rrf2 family transcriptional regulator [unclassified Novosphingobium]